VVPSRIHQSNMIAVHHAAQLTRQSSDVTRRNMMLQRQFLLSRPLPAPPEDGQTVEHDVTSLGLEANQSYTIKEALVSEGIYQFELLDAENKVLWSGVGDNREDAYLSMAIRLTDSEGPDDLPDYT
jgi:hypothetical protein